MHFDNSFIRRMNDEEYEIAFSKFLDELTEKDNKKFLEECKQNPRLKRQYEYRKKRLEQFSSEKFADFLIDCIQVKAKEHLNEIIEFNEKWDKEHYKVIYGKFGG